MNADFTGTIKAKNLGLRKEIVDRKNSKGTVEVFTRRA